MNNRPECIPCCLRRVLHGADFVSSNEWLHRKILGEAMEELGRVDELATPAELVFTVARLTSKTLGVQDPYADEKRRWAQEVAANTELIESQVSGASDPFVAALKLSLAANLIDWELREALVPGFSLRTLLEEVDRLSLSAESVEEFRQAVERAPSLLFVHASAGELFFDRLLIEKMKKPRDAVVSVVREAPILGDATRGDAEALGLEGVASLLDPGIDCRGIPLSACSQAFRDAFAAAGLVVAKGQAAYETLEGDESLIEGAKKEIFYLLRVKCGVMARQLGVEVGDCVLESN
jgi:uncharacterized protein with ATP-grasp and redox domains